MALDRALGQKKRGCDFAVRVALGSQPQHLAFSVRKDRAIDGVACHARQNAKPRSDGAHRGEERTVELVLKYQRMNAGASCAPGPERPARW
jgi:hypothetical protein